MRLIDADALIKSTDKESVHMWQIALAPTVDPIKHGHWIIERGETVTHCNSCGWAYEYYGGLEEEWNYCPHCGAKMDEVEK